MIALKKEIIFISCDSLKEFKDICEILDCQIYHDDGVYTSSIITFSKDLEDDLLYSGEKRNIEFLKRIKCFVDYDNCISVDYSY